MFSRKEAVNRERGNKSELLARQYLERQGLKFIEKNFHSRFGELDLVMQDKDTLVFIEVRYRSSSSFGTPAETITPGKQSKIIKTASVFLQQHAKLAKYPARFDVISIDGDIRHENVSWIKNAFQT